MLKLFGLVCIVLVGASFGLKASLKLSARYKRLVDFYIFLGEICDCMRVGYDIEGIFAKESAEKLFTLNGYKITPKTSNLQKKDSFSLYLHSCVRLTRSAIQQKFHLC